MVEKIIRKRVPLKATARVDDGAVVETEIGIPRNSLIVNNSVIDGDIGTENSVSNQKNNKQESFRFGGRENGFKKIGKFCLEIQFLKFSAKISIL